MSYDYGRPVRDDYEDWQRSVDREWERRERLAQIDERWDKEGEPVSSVTPKRIRALHPATAALAVAGTTQTQIAEVMGVTQAAVSQWFSGRRGAPPELPKALEGLLGPDKAATVLDAIPNPSRKAS